MEHKDLDIKRDLFFDIVKCLAIFLVIWGHVIQQSCMLDNPNEDLIFCWIYSFHMPLFMGVCGYFLSKSIKKYECLDDFVHNKLYSRIASLVRPMFVFAFIKISLMIYFDRGCINIGYQFFRQAHRIWFLGDLVINTVLLVSVAKICSGEFKKDVKLFILLMPLSAIPYIGYGELGLFMYPFFVIGFCINHYDFCYKKTIELQYVVLLYILSFVIFNMVSFLPQNFTLDFSKYTMVQVFVIDSLKYIMGLTGGYVSLSLCHVYYKKANHNKLFDHIVSSGQHTLEIYLFNIIILEMLGGKYYHYLIDFLGVNILYNYGIIAEGIMTFIIACMMFELLYFMSVLVSKSKVLSKIFFSK